MPNVGYATIQIIPSVRGIGDEIRSQLVGPADDAGAAAGEAAGGSLKEKLLAGAAAAGVAAGALLIAGLTEAMDQANITSTLQAQLGATGKDASRYGKIAGELYSKGITESFEQGAEAIRSVVNAGLVSPDATNAQLESLSAKMSDVATTFGTDMSMQTQAVAAMFKNGLAPDAESALDLITVGFQKLGPNADDLLDTFQEYSVQFKKLGINGEEALGLFQQGLRAGARDTDIIADAFKEFSIRAIDMSTTSQDAYKAIGLDAEKMSLQIAKGGDSAGEGLQLVLDKLREMKDPVARNAAAVGLFGTQAEDLGTALFALDPNAAIDGFGKITGAAGVLGTTLHSGPSHEIEVFARTLKQTLVDFIGGEVLPVVSQLAHSFNSEFLPPLTAVASVVAATLLPALKGLVTGGLAVISWLREWGAWLLPVIVLIGGLTLALNAQAIATAAVTAVFSVYRAAILLGTAVTSGFASAQALLNAVMALNPITLIVIALVALGTALVVAYKKSETFRAVVQAAWEGIKTVALWVWENALKPAFAGFMAGLRAIADAALWLWGVLQPVFSFIAGAGRILATIILTILIAPIVLAVKVLGAIFGWLWETIIKPVFSLIAALAVWLWNVALKPAFDGIMVIVRNVAAVFTWLWTNIIKPVWNYIAGLIAEKWQQIKLIFDVVVAYVRTVLAPQFMRFWTDTIRPAWEGIKSIIANAWNSGIRPIFDLLSRGVDNVKSSFNTAITAIGIIWDRLKDITRRPVQFVIDTVYNNGIRKVWNTIADFTGAGKLGALTFADGGRTAGGTPGKDSIPALMMADEYVIRRDSARKLGFGTLDYMNRYGALPGFANGGQVQRFKDGGVVGWIKGAVGSVGEFFGDMTDLITNPGKAWTAATGFIRDKIASISGSGMGRLIGGIPTKILSSLKDKVVNLIGSFGGGADIGGSGVQRWAPVVLQALRMVGQPASMLATTLRRMNQESGGNPFAINNWDSNAQAGDPSRGLMQTIGSTFNAYAGPLRSRGIYDPLANIYASMRYALATYGSLPRAYDRAGGYDAGGWLQPGLTLANNKTGKPEAVLTSGQWAAIASGRGGLQPGDQLALVVDDREFHAYVDSRADGRVALGARQLVETIRPGRKG